MWECSPTGNHSKCLGAVTLLNSFIDWSGLAKLSCLLYKNKTGPFTLSISLIGLFFLRDLPALKETKDNTSNVWGKVGLFLFFNWLSNNSLKVVNVPSQVIPFKLLG